MRPCVASGLHRASVVRAPNPPPTLPTPNPHRLYPTGARTTQGGEREAQDVCLFPSPPTLAPTRPTRRYAMLCYAMLCYAMPCPSSTRPTRRSVLPVRARHRSNDLLRRSHDVLLRENNQLQVTRRHALRPTTHQATQRRRKHPVTSDHLTAAGEARAAREHFRGGLPVTRRPRRGMNSGQTRDGTGPSRAVI
jgi:hypothetical protein